MVVTFLSERSHRSGECGWCCRLHVQVGRVVIATATKPEPVLVLL